MKVLAASLGDCVHVAGATRFLRAAEELGAVTHFTGPATHPEALMDAIVAFQPDIIGLSYRLTPDNLRPLLDEFIPMLRASGVEVSRLAFAGTPPVVAVAREYDIFEAFFEGGESSADVKRYLVSQASGPAAAADFPQDVVSRIRWKAPFPLLRHHYGEPALTIEPTRLGIEKIARAGVLDVISLGADQDAQENFFHPYAQDPRSRGAGGVPFRSEADLVALYEASRHGNFPLVRSYSGTADHLRYAEMLVRTISNAWCATSLFFFNAMDGRGPSPLRQSIEEHADLMRWHGERGIPVEGNEPYHWGMRDAPDVVVCASSAILARVMKKAGVKDYITTYMFESPPHLSNRMDLAKCLAQISLAESLADDSFRVWRQSRTGLLSFPLSVPQARAHLAQSIMLQMAIHPSIIHIVGYTEAHHAADADEVIESALMATGVIDTALRGNPDMTADPLIRERRDELLAETAILLSAIETLGEHSEDPLTDPAVLAEAVRVGLLDAPQLVNNAFARGAVRTASVDGAIRVVDERNRPVSEAHRSAHILANLG